MKSNIKRRRLSMVLLLTILSVFVSITMIPHRSYAASYPSIINKYTLGEEFTDDNIDLEYLFYSGYKYNRYEMTIVRLEDDVAVATASDEISLYDSSTRDVGISLDTTDLTPGSYTTYARTYFYSYNKWNESPNNVDNDGRGGFCGIFVIKKALTNKKVVLSKTKLTYNGKVQHPRIETVGGRYLTAGEDYTVNYSNASSKAPGVYTLTVTGKGNYFGTSATATYKILNANKLIAKPKAVTAKAGQTVPAKKAFKVKKATGKVTYKKASGNAKIVISKKGDVKIKKGLKPGTYKVKVKVTAKGSATVAPKTVKVVLKVKVK